MAIPSTIDCIIIGGGCAGLTAALYLGRAKLNVLLFAGNLQDKGGMLSKTTLVENFPGFPNGIEGYDLIANMEEQARANSVTIIDCDARSLSDNSVRGTYNVIDESNHCYSARTIIVATGSKPRVLGLPNEDPLWGHGISSCATCDGALYRNKTIVVVGGGDSAVEETLFLTRFSNVILIHRRDTLRASRIMQDRVLNHPKVTILFNTTVTKLCGTGNLESIIIETNTGQTRELKVDGLFYGLGLVPNTSLFKGYLELDPEGYIVKRQHPHYHTLTSTDGIFVAGDAEDKRYRQAIVAAGSGCQAAMDVIDYLSR